MREKDSWHGMDNRVKGLRPQDDRHDDKYTRTADMLCDSVSWHSLDSAQEESCRSEKTCRPVNQQVPTSSHLIIPPPPTSPDLQKPSGIEILLLLWSITATPTTRRAPPPAPHPPPSGHLLHEWDEKEGEKKQQSYANEGVVQHKMDFR
ncbi:hypothetical protein NHX12_032683 [Muraenolepis orangiensis]|uniref:Uncharacterized protein n=1 Tax=Muraenolepis orangiensis TaxID=630683 RepID=A0A9Q0E7N5_9TELE|nr:hypothetical protein NHX12_032683 [Muraenolepis orangiensis]